MKAIREWAGVLALAILIAWFLASNCLYVIEVRSAHLSYVYYEITDEETGEVYKAGYRSNVNGHFVFYSLVRPGKLCHFELFKVSEGCCGKGRERVIWSVHKTHWPFTYNLIG